MSSVMSGADAEQLDRVAREIESLAGRFGASRSSISRNVNAAPWRGRSADRFRQQWGSEYARALSSAEQFLRDAARDLRHNADQQRDASRAAVGSGLNGAGGPSGGGWDLDGLLRFLDLPMLVGGVGLQVLGGFVSAAGSRVVTAGPHRFWRRGENETMRRLVGSVEDLDDAVKGLGKVSTALDLISAGSEGIEQWNEDQGRPVDERLARAVAVGGAHAAVSFGAAAAGAKVGAALGTFIPVPVVGTLAGGAAGALIGWGVAWAMENGGEDRIADAASWGYQRIRDGLEEVGEVGSDVVRTGGRIIEGGANLIGGGIRKLGSLW